MTGKRFDRDFRKQKIMTFRTLLLENMLMEFMIDLRRYLKIEISLETMLSVFFMRSGVYIETESEVIYQMNTNGLSLSYKNKLREITEALTKMKISHNNKSVRVQLKRSIND